MAMYRDGLKSDLRAYNSLAGSGFHAFDLSDQFSMLFVDLFTPSGHQGEALGAPRFNHHLWNAISLLIRQLGPDALCHAVCERNDYVAHRSVGGRATGRTHIT